MIGRKKKQEQAASAIEPRHYDIIRTPVVTEKTTGMSEHNKVAFKVGFDVSKKDVKEAVEKIFNTKVEAVNIIKIPGKIKRTRGREGRRQDYKKAIVSLAKGQKIDVMAGV